MELLYPFQSRRVNVLKLPCGVVVHAGAGAKSFRPQSHRAAEILGHHV